MLRSQLPSIPFTKVAFAKLKVERTRLAKLREEVVVRLTAAREMGDLSENGAYKYAKMELGDIGRQLRQINYQLKFGHVVSNTSTDGRIDFGNTVTIENENKTITFMLVSEYESNPAEHKLSTESPIGQAVVGKKVGDTITVKLPNGTVSYRIAQVE